MIAQIMKRRMAAFTLMCVVLMLLDAPGQSAAEIYTSIEQLHGKKIGSTTGTTYDDTVRRRLPDVTFSYFNNYSDMVTALKAGKIAAFACDEPVLETSSRKTAR